MAQKQIHKSKPARIFNTQRINQF